MSMHLVNFVNCDILCGIRSDILLMDNFCCIRRIYWLNGHVPIYPSQASKQIVHVASSWASSVVFPLKSNLSFLFYFIFSLGFGLKKNDNICFYSIINHLLTHGVWFFWCEVLGCVVFEFYFWKGVVVAWVKWCKMRDWWVESFHIFGFWVEFSPWGELLQKLLLSKQKLFQLRLLYVAIFGGLVNV